jgi:hypothetical protein
LPVIVFSGTDAASSEASGENYCEDGDNDGFPQDKVQEVILENRWAFLRGPVAVPSRFRFEDLRREGAIRIRKRK